MPSTEQLRSAPRSLVVVTNFIDVLRAKVGG